MQLITVNVRDEGQRFDKFLAKYLPAAPNAQKEKYCAQW